MGNHLRWPDEIEDTEWPLAPDIKDVHQKEVGTMTLKINFQHSCVQLWYFLFAFICAADNLYFTQICHVPPGSGLPKKCAVLTAYKHYIFMRDKNTFEYRGWLTHSTLKIVLGSSNPIPQPCAEKQPKSTLDWYLCCDSQDLEGYCTAYGKAEPSVKAPKQEPCQHKKPTSPRQKHFDKHHLHSTNVWF